MKLKEHAFKAIRPPEWPKSGWYWCLHHSVKLEWTHNIDERWDYIVAEKPPNEVPTRLAAIRPLRGELPQIVIDACKRQESLEADWLNSDDLIMERYHYGAYVVALHAYFDIIASSPEVAQLFNIECEDVPWDDNGLIFEEE